MSSKKKEKPVVIPLKNFSVQGQQENDSNSSLYSYPHQLVFQNRIKEGGLLPDERTQASYGIRLRSSEQKFVDPYSIGYKARLANMYEFDYVARSCVDTLVYYILGREPKAKLYPNTRQQYKTNEEAAAALETVLTQQEQRDLQDYIDTVDLTSQIYDYQNIGSALTQMFVYGRSALLKIPSKEAIPELNLIEGSPIDVKPLTSYYLGQVYVDPENWEVTEIQYTDNIFGKDPKTGEEYKERNIPIERLIYFTNYDRHVSPNNLCYGLSAFQPVLSISEMNRRLNQQILPEITNSQWCGVGHWKTEGMSGQEMQEFAASLKPATHLMYNQNVTFEEIKLTHDLAGLQNLRDANVRELLKAFGIPSVLLNYEEVTNRATTDKVLLVWQQTRLEGLRNLVRQFMWKYHYRPLLEAYYPDKQFLAIRAKIITEFLNIEFSNMPDKADAIWKLVPLNVISVEEAREMLYLPPYPPDLMEQYESNMQAMQQIQQERNNQQQAKNIPQQQPQPPANSSDNMIQAMKQQITAKKKQNAS